MTQSPLTHSPLTRGPAHRRIGVAGAAAVSVALLAGGAAAPSDARPAEASPAAVSRAAVSSGVVRATSTNRTNPLAGRPWGVYKGKIDMAWTPYTRATGTTRRLLGKIALRPKAAWFGKWNSNSTIKASVERYIANSTGGNPAKLVQMTVFRSVPWEHKACNRLPTAAEVASYKQWINRFASGVHSTHLALILQPDGPFALCVPHHSTLPSRLIAYAAKRLSALPHTSVYIDGGASDWPARKPGRAASFLVPAGVRYARGFALNATHYSSTGSNIDFGTQVVAALAKRGVRGKHFVISTSSNGRGFSFNRARGASPDNAKTCASKGERVCVTLGIPPTADVAAARWRLATGQRVRAARLVDGYLWFGRPWLVMQSSPFSRARAIEMARTTPY